MERKKIKTSSLIIGIVIELLFAIFIGFTTGPSFGSHYPQLNLVAKPFVCPNGHMTYTNQNVQRYDETYWAATWFCADKQSGIKTELDSNSVFRYASPLYISLWLAIFFILTYVYWYSSTGPAKNNGIHLW